MQSASRSCRRFTLIELLVVVAIIAILAGMLLPVLAKSREKSRRASCMSQVKQQLTAVMIYTGEWDDRTPVAANDGCNWMWDLNSVVVDELMSRGITRQMLYCPSNPVMRADKTALWTTYPAFRIIGYYYLFDRQGIGGLTGVTLNGSAFVSRLTNVANPTTQELITDASIEPGNDNFSRWTSGGIEVSSNHAEGTALGGTNVGFVDGHAEWRTQANTYERWDQGGASGDHWF